MHREDAFSEFDGSGENPADRGVRFWRGEKGEGAPAGSRVRRRLWGTLVSLGSAVPRVPYGSEEEDRAAFFADVVPLAGVHAAKERQRQLGIGVGCI